MRPVEFALALGLGFALVVAGACGDNGNGGSVGGAAPPPKTLFGGARPVTLEVPRTYDAKQPTPLLLVLHGFGASGLIEESYLQLHPLVDSEGILLAAPDGTVNQMNREFWNATDACCNFDGSSVDDVAYLSGLIDEIKASYNVDPKRVYVLGHSNGAFMAYRMACERTDKLAAIVSLAGATWNDPSRCTPSRPLSVLEIHGDQDQTILYGGGSIMGAVYPSVHDTVTRWATYDGCNPATTNNGAAIDLDVQLAGAETTVTAFGGCPSGIAVELWTIVGGVHVPAVGPSFATQVWAWMMAHPGR